MVPDNKIGKRVLSASNASQTPIKAAFAFSVSNTVYWLAELNWSLEREKKDDLITII